MAIEKNFSIRNYGINHRLDIDCLSKVFEVSKPRDVFSFHKVCTLWKQVIENNATYKASPKLNREKGRFEATIISNGEKIFLRMERLTKENADVWHQYMKCTYLVAQNHRMGMMIVPLVTDVTEGYPPHYMMKEKTGFTPEEHEEFKKKLTALIQQNKKLFGAFRQIEDSLFPVTGGSSSSARGLNFVVYATKNENFSIRWIDNQKCTVKEHIELYADVLISCSSALLQNGSCFRTDAMCRNPHWIIEQKYSGLSMPLAGMIGAVAEKFFRKRSVMRFDPTRFIGERIKAELRRGDGHVMDGNTKKDIMDAPESCVVSNHYLTVPALSRIFYESAIPQEQSNQDRSNSS